MWADQGELTKFPGIAAALRVQLARRVSLLHWEWCTINNELRTVRRRVVEFWVVAHATDGSLQQRLLVVASGLTCGCKRSQKVWCHPRKGARRCVYFSDFCLEWHGLRAKPSNSFCQKLATARTRCRKTSRTAPMEPKRGRRLQDVWARPWDTTIGFIEITPP